MKRTTASCWWTRVRTAWRKFVDFQARLSHSDRWDSRRRQQSCAVLQSKRHLPSKIAACSNQWYLMNWDVYELVSKLKRQLFWPDASKTVLKLMNFSCIVMPILIRWTSWCFLQVFLLFMFLRGRQKFNQIALIKKESCWSASNLLSRQVEWRQKVAKP